MSRVDYFLPSSHSPTPYPILNPYQNIKELNKLKMIGKDVYPKFHLSLLDFSLEDLNSLHPYQLALVAFHGDAEQIHKVKAESLFLRWRERDRKFHAVGEIELTGTSSNEKSKGEEEKEEERAGREDDQTITPSKIIIVSNLPPPTPRSSETNLEDFPTECNHSIGSSLVSQSPFIETVDEVVTSVKGGWTGIKAIELSTTGQFYQPISTICHQQQQQQQQQHHHHIARSISPTSTRRRSTFPDQIPSVLPLPQEVLTPTSSPVHDESFSPPPPSAPIPHREREKSVTTQHLSTSRSPSLMSRNRNSASLPPPPLSPSPSQLELFSTSKQSNNVATTSEDEDMDLETDEEQEEAVEVEVEVEAEEDSIHLVEEVVEAVGREEEGSPDVWAELHLHQLSVRKEVIASSRRSISRERSSRHHHDHSDRRDRNKRERSRSQSRDRNSDRIRSHRRAAEENYSSSHRSRGEEEERKSSRDYKRREEGGSSSSHRYSRHHDDAPSSSSRRARDDEEYYSRSSKILSSRRRSHRREGSLGDYKQEDQIHHEEEDGSQTQRLLSPSSDHFHSPAQRSSHYEDNGDIVSRDSTPRATPPNFRRITVVSPPLSFHHHDELKEQIEVDQLGSDDSDSLSARPPIIPSQFQYSTQSTSIYQSTLPSPPLSLPLSNSSPSIFNIPSPPSTNTRPAPPPPPASIPTEIEKTLLYVHIGGVDPQVSLELLRHFIIRPNSKLHLPKPTALVWGGCHSDHSTSTSEKFAYAAYQSRNEVLAVSSGIGGSTMPGIGRMTKTLITNVLDECSEVFEWNDLSLDIKLYWEEKNQLLVSKERLNDRGEGIDSNLGGGDESDELSSITSRNYMKELRRLGLGGISSTTSSSTTTTTISTLTTYPNSNKRSRRSRSKSSSLDAIGSVESDFFDNYQSNIPIVEPKVKIITPPTTIAIKSISRKKSRLDFGNIFTSRTNVVGRKGKKAIVSNSSDYIDEILKEPKQEEEEIDQLLD